MTAVADARRLLTVVAHRDWHTLMSTAAGSARVSPLARAVRREGLTYLSWPKLRSLETVIGDLRRRGVHGDFLEAGVAMGGSAVLLATNRPPGAAFHGYDVFGLIPEPGEDDERDAHDRYKTIASGGSRGLMGGEYYGYQDDLIVKVASALAAHGAPPAPDQVELHQGLFDDTLHPSGPVALAHIDCDWHDGVLTCLRRIHPQLTPGGALILDDYNDYLGCAKAAHTFLAEAGDLLVVRSRPHLVLERRNGSALA